MPKKQEKRDIKELFAEFDKTKDPKIREEIIERNLYIAEILAKKCVNRGMDYDDLYQVASIGLILAVDRYDVSKGFEFSSYATPTIMGEIKKYFRDRGWVIRVPRRIQEVSKKVNNAKTYLSQSLQRSPTIKDIANYLKISEEEVLDALVEMAPAPGPREFDSQDDDREVNLADLIGIEDEYFSKIEMQDFINRTMTKLNDMERKILKDRYYDMKTQIVIAEELGISQMTVSRMEKKIIEKFRVEMDKTMKNG